MRSMRIGLAQINLTVGDLSGNVEKIIDYISRAQKQACDIVAFPELAITGYPAEDLLLRPEFIRDNLAGLQKLLPHSKDMMVLVGFVDKEDDIYNAAALLYQQKIAGVYRKQFLPNYGVFDENRYFQSGNEFPVFDWNGIKIGVNICEDIWYPGGPIRQQTLFGEAEIIINISASPYSMDKIQDRTRMLSVRAEDNEVILAYVNLVGGQDELIFDGDSLILSEEGKIMAKAPSFEEALIIADVHPDNVFSKRLHDPRRRKEKLLPSSNPNVPVIRLDNPLRVKKKPALTPPVAPDLSRIEEIYRALTLGARDYLDKNGFRQAILGLSGGVDSALVCAIAVDALGAENILAVSMPSEYSSQSSIDDARKLAENLKVQFREIPITSLFKEYLAVLEPHFKDLPRDVTEENLQARIRGNILMAFSNKTGGLVLTTGNKSEFSTGYCTLYGDMAGGFAVIKDVPKLVVYQLCRYRNSLAGYDLIPESILTKAPSAELRPDQKDSDSLPPYEILDPIIELYVEADHSVDEIVSRGFERDTVEKVIKLINLNEYKRRQGAPGIKITARAFGKDRRFPITNRYRSR